MSNQNLEVLVSTLSKKSSTTSATNFRVKKTAR
ncbi:hypothetical protein BN1805_01520 [Proteus vulgaris]|nr:hypothetical protein BN1805_01520 [Proteus vulgaris]